MSTSFFVEKLVLMLGFESSMLFCLLLISCVINFTGSNITTGNGSIFLSETDLSSEEDTLFANGNGNTHNLNKQDNFVKANNLKNKFRA